MRYGIFLLFLVAHSHRIRAKISVGVVPLRSFFFLHFYRIPNGMPERADGIKEVLVMCETSVKDKQKSD